MNQTIVAIVIISIFVFFGRFTVTGHGLSWPGTYEAFAHICMGYLIGVAILRYGDERHVAVLAVGLLSTFELLMFLIR